MTIYNQGSYYALQNFTGTYDVINRDGDVIANDLDKYAAICLVNQHGAA